MRFSSKIGRKRRSNEDSIDEPELESVWIKNFKAFQDWEKIPIRPITLIFGKNSAGKSSVFHSLLWLRELHRTGSLNIRRTARSGDFMDLGGLDQYIHKSKEGNQTEIGYKIVLADKKNKIKNKYDEILKKFYKFFPLSLNFVSRQDHKKIEEKYQKLKSNKNKSSQTFGVNKLEGDIIEVEVLFRLDQSDFLNIKNKQDFKPQPTFKIFFNKRLLLSLNFINQKVISLGKKDESDLKKEADFYEIKLGDFVISDLKDEFLTFWGLLFDKEQDQIPQQLPFEDPHKLSFLQRGSNWLDWNGTTLGLRAYPSSRYRFLNRHFIRGRGDVALSKISDFSPAKQEKALMENPEMLLQFMLEDIYGPLFEEIFKIKRNVLRKLLFNLNYIPAVRKYPERLLFENNLYNSPDEYIYGDKSYKSLLSNPRNLKRIRMACRKLSANFEFRISSRLRSVFGRSLVLYHTKTKKEISFRDIGFGWSQVFPVLIEILADESPLLMIEQPELHLHPKAQSELMEIIIEQVTFERIVKRKSREKSNLFPFQPIMLEAHSEQMVIRLLHCINNYKKISETGLIRLKPEDCAILYISNEEESSRIKEIEIDKKGNIGNQWPDGFFASALKDLIGISEKEENEKPHDS